MASIFSQIASGEIPASFVFKEDHWFGILDLHPVAPGHLLVIPTEEVALIKDLPEPVLAAMGPTIARASDCLYRALGCDAISILIRDGGAAGQEIPHVHVHLVPRNHGDDPHAFQSGEGDEDKVVRSALDDIQDQLTSAWR